MPTLSELVGSWDSGAAETHDGELTRSVPTRVSIPALGVRAKVVEVGRAPDGSIAVPSSDPAKATGWYAPGPAPGERGTAVIVGHVDTASQPAIFEKLGDLRKGRIIEVKRTDRRVATFKVDSVETVPKTAFPTDRIFQPAPRPRLVLVTCGGAWVGGQIGYADNVIVYATLS
jgi:sortase (surface protein transpeptidase)